MNVLVIGATGYLGGAAARELQAAGHKVIAPGRSAESRALLLAAGYAVTQGDVAEPEGLLDDARAADAVLYAVQLARSDAAAVEKRALTALLGALERSAKPFIYTSGVWCYGATGDAVADETTPPNPPPFLAERPAIERIVLDAAGRGVRSVVVRPGDVYGEGKGLPAMWAQSARASGRARYIGDGSNRWAVVHVDDLARLYRLALASAAPGSVYNAVDETAFTVVAMARAASRGAGCDGAVDAWPVDAAMAALGPWAQALAMDQRVTSARARADLGWTPRTSTILDDLEHGSYVR